jgi:hypothetical protein
MVNVLTTNLIPDPQKSKEEKLAIGRMPSQYPPMTNHMAKAHREIHRHPTKITLLTDTNKTMLPLVIRPTCRHQIIRRSRSQREELSYATMMTGAGKAVTPDAKMIRHDGKPAEMADPREGTDLAMTTTCTAAVTRTSIALLTVTMTNGKAPATVMTIHLHEEQKEAVIAAKISHRTARANDGVTLHHPHHGAPMVAVVVAADQQGCATLARIRWTRSPTMPVHI